jgi:HPr kinase/phosphorylase
VEISRLAASTLEGRCPALLRDFLEVRGLGLLNIRTIFGETAVRPKMKLKLIAHLEKPLSGTVREARERLPLAELSEDILGITVRKVVIPVAEAATSRCSSKRRCATTSCSCAASTRWPNSCCGRSRKWKTRRRSPEAKSPQR